MQSVNLKRMRYISFVWGFVMFGLVIALTAYGFFYKNQTKEYKSLETYLEEKAQEYVEQEGILIEDNIKITKDDLISKEFIKDVKVRDKSCESYVIVTNNANNLKYDAYINCTKYKTKNYDKNI